MLPPLYFLLPDLCVWNHVLNVWEEQEVHWRLEEREWGGGEAYALPQMVAKPAPGLDHDTLHPQVLEQRRSYTGVMR